MGFDLPSLNGRRAGLVAALLLATAFFTVPSPLSGASEAESASAPQPRSQSLPTDAAKPAAKSAAGAQGRIDGYLAGGRWREGTKLVDIVGQFKVSADRAAFHPADGKSRFLCLENLNSERVARIVAESPEALNWIVQGTITEFRGENYLLISQAVIRTRTARQPRATIEEGPTSGDIDAGNSNASNTGF
jgi:hypothetical protein